MIYPYSEYDYTYYPNIRIAMPDIYESDLAVKETAEMYRYKIIEWLKRGAFDEVLDLLKVENGRVKPGKSETDKSNRKAKTKYIKDKFLTESGMSGIISMVKSKTGMSATDFLFNKDLVKRTIRKMFKNKIAKHID